MYSNGIKNAKGSTCDACTCEYIHVMTSGIVVWETDIKTKDNVSENI